MKLGAEQRYLRGDQMQRDETPIEWERDSMGRKFRRVGKGCIEYAPTITLAGGIEIYEDELEDFHKRQKEAEERRKAAELEAWKNRPEPRSCPFANGCNNTCMRDQCKIFYDGQCSIATVADAAGVEIEEEPAKGKKCPFSIYGKCEGCALYNHGCAITRIAAAYKKERI